MRNVLPPSAGTSVVGAVEVCVVPVDCCGMCCVCWLSSAVWVLVTCDELSYDWSGIVIGGRFSRSSGTSGGAIGGWPLIISGPLALLSNVDQPPLPRVAPILHET